MTLKDEIMEKVYAMRAGFAIKITPEGDQLIEDSFKMVLLNDVLKIIDKYEVKEDEIVVEAGDIQRILIWHSNCSVECGSELCAFDGLHYEECQKVKTKLTKTLKDKEVG